MDIAKTIAHRLLETEEDIDPLADVTRLTQSQYPGYEIEYEHGHWSVYKLIHGGTDKSYIGELYYDDMASAPDNLPPESRAHWDANRWTAIAGQHPDEIKAVASFDNAVKFIINVNTTKLSRPPRNENLEDDPVDAEDVVKRYSQPTSITLKNGYGHLFHFILSMSIRKNGPQLGVPSRMTHDDAGLKNEPIVHIFDANYAGKTPEWEHGQPVATYYAADISHHTGSLNMMSNVPDWTLTADTVKQLTTWLQDELEVKREYRYKDEGGVTGSYYESLDPDSPELYTHPEQFTAQPSYEKLESSLRIMLRPYYDEIKINREPAALAPVFKGLRDYYTWTIRCQRHSPLKLPTGKVDYGYGTAVDWRKQVQHWFTQWAERNDLFFHNFKLCGRLRKDPTFQFVTHRLPEKGVTIRGERVSESVDDPEGMVTTFVDNADWMTDLRGDLWTFHPYGVGYKVAGLAPEAFVIAQTFFPPDTDDFATRFNAFVIDWIKKRNIVPVRTTKLTVQQTQDGTFPEWMVIVSVNSEWPTDTAPYTPPPVKVGESVSRLG